MRKYQIILDVPDDFDPNELDINFTYKDDINISAESFYPVSEQAQELVSKIESIDSMKDNIVILKADLDKENAQELFDEMSYVKSVLEMTGGPDVLCLNSNIDVLVQNRAQAIDMLKKMIDKINLRSSIQLV